MTFSILRRFCVVTTFAAACCVLSSAVLADLTTARIALQTRQFELVLDQAKDLATTYPFDSAMIAARAHVELGQLTKRSELPSARKHWNQSWWHPGS
jgi:hypothetical protein